MASEQKSTSDLSLSETVLQSVNDDYSSTKSQNPCRWLTQFLWRYVLCDSWDGEYYATIFSWASLGSIAGVLWVWDGRPVSQLPSTITLNAVNSVLATASKSALIFSVASSISQWKWIWYGQQKARKLNDLQIFDEASRGPLGALRLCTTQTGSSLGAVGALIILISMLFDPFIQQLLVYPVDSVYTISNTTWTSLAYRYPPTGVSTDPALTYPSFSIEDALWSDSSADLYEHKPICPSNNCNWDKFSSLGFCTKCTEILDKANISYCDARPNSFDGYGVNSSSQTSRLYNSSQTLMKTCNITFDSGVAISITLFAYMLENKWWLDLPQYVVSEVYNFIPENLGPKNSFVIHNQSILGQTNPLSAIGAAKLRIVNGTIDVVSAQVCTLDFCLREYNVEVKEGVPSINISQVTYGNKFISPFDNSSCWTIADTPFNTTSLTEVKTSPYYTLEGKIHKDIAFCYEKANFSTRNHLSEQMESLVNGNLSQEVIACSLVTCSPDEVAPGVSVNDYWALYSEKQSSTYIDRIASTHLTPFMENLAARLTKLAVDASEQKLYGYAGAKVTFIRVQWLWLILPVILETIGLAFLLATRFASKKHKVPLWKASLWPLLFQGLEHEVPVRANIGDMQDMADNMSVRLKYDDEGRLVLGR